MTAVGSHGREPAIAGQSSAAERAGEVSPTHVHHQSYWRVTLALALVYAATASGHFQSVDGMLMFHQARSLMYDHSLIFREPFWWGDPIYISKYGIGLSILYLPGIALFSWLEPYVHVPGSAPTDYMRMYVDPVFTAAGSTVQIAIVASSAYLVGRVCGELRIRRSPTLWAMVLFGLASPAITYARGDFAQPLAGLCWIAGIYAGLLVLRTGRFSWFLTLAVFYGILARPLEGALLVPAVLILGAAGRHASRATAAALLGAGLGIAVTVFVNYGRYGSWTSIGYEGEGWTAPIWLGATGLLVSPGRGLLWAFPATLLAIPGALFLWNSGRRSVAASLLFPPVALLLLMSPWYMWWGGVNWGPRLLIPALPIIAVLAGAGLEMVPEESRNRLPALLLVTGMLWSIPTLLVDLNVYGRSFASSESSFILGSHPLATLPPLLEFWRAYGPTAVHPHAVDILWFRAAHRTGGLSLLVPVLLLAIAAWLSLGPLSASRPPGMPLRR